MIFFLNTGFENIFRNNFFFFFSWQKEQLFKKIESNVFSSFVPGDSNKSSSKK